MDKIVKIVKNIYQNTYKSKKFRDLLNLTRLLMMFINSLIIAFFANIYISQYITEYTFIFVMITSTVVSYYLSFSYIYKQYPYNKNNENLNLKYIYHYLYIEAIILSLIIIKVYFYIKSIYI